MKARLDLRQVKTGRRLVLPLLPHIAGALRHCAPFEPFAAENNLATIMRDVKWGG